MAHDPDQPTAPIPTPPDPPGPRPPAPARRRGPLYAGGIVVVLVVALGLGVLAARLLPAGGGTPVVGVAVPAGSPSPAIGAAPSPAPSAAPSPAAASYEVAPGDTLKGIARRFYGDPDAWQAIYEANRRAIGPDPDALEAGTRLAIPSRGPAPTRTP